MQGQRDPLIRRELTIKAALNTVQNYFSGEIAEGAVGMLISGGGIVYSIVKQDYAALALFAASEAVSVAYTATSYFGKKATANAQTVGTTLQAKVTSLTDEKAAAERELSGARAQLSGNASEIAREKQGAQDARAAVDTLKQNQQIQSLLTFVEAKLSVYYEMLSKVLDFKLPDSVDSLFEDSYQTSSNHEAIQSLISLVNNFDALLMKISTDPNSSTSSSAPPTPSKPEKAPENIDEQFIQKLIEVLSDMDRAVRTKTGIEGGIYFASEQISTKFDWAEKRCTGLSFTFERLLYTLGRIKGLPQGKSVGFE